MNSCGGYCQAPALQSSVESAVYLLTSALGLIVSRDWQELPDVRENLFRKTKRNGQLKLLLKRISNRTDPVEFGPGNPPCKPGPKSCGYNWIVAAVKDLTWIFPEPAESFQVGDLRQGGDVSVQVRKGFPHFVELIEIIPIPWQGRRAAMGCDDGYPALEW